MRRPPSTPAPSHLQSSRSWVLSCARSASPAPAASLLGPAASPTAAPGAAAQRRSRSSVAYAPSAAAATCTPCTSSSPAAAGAAGAAPAPPSPPAGRGWACWVISSAASSRVAMQSLSWAARGTGSRPAGQGGRAAGRRRMSDCRGKQPSRSGLPASPALASEEMQQSSAFLPWPLGCRPPPAAAAQPRQLGTGQAFP